MLGPSVASRDVRPLWQLEQYLQDRRVQLGALVVIFCVALSLRLWPLYGESGISSGGSEFYDEGVYWASLHAMAAGRLPFRDIFSSQPPGFLLCIYPFYLLFGQTLEAARIGIILYSLLGILATYHIGRCAGGRWLGVIAGVLLSLDPLYAEQSRVVQAEMPALALMLTAIALVAEAPRHAGLRRKGFAVAAGLTLGLSVTCKVFTLVAVVPVLLYLMKLTVERIPAQLGAWRHTAVSQVHNAADDGFRAVLMLAGVFAAVLLVLLPFLQVLPQVYDQSITFHFVAARTLNKGVGYNLALIDLIGRNSGEYWLAFAALAGFLLAVWRRFWVILPLFGWFLASLLFLIIQQPLYDQHVVLLTPPLALTAGLALPAALHDTNHVRLASMSTSSPGRQPRYGPALARAAATLCVSALLLLVFYASVPLDVQLSLQAAAPLSSVQVPMVSALQSHTLPTDLIVTDDQRIAMLAGRDVPPQLVDTSATRIKSGYLTSVQLETIIADSHVRAVLFASGRFDLLPDFRIWVGTSFPHQISFGQGRTLYFMSG